jgi:hypothetical protein
MLLKMLFEGHLRLAGQGPAVGARKAPQLIDQWLRDAKSNSLLLMTIGLSICGPHGKYCMVPCVNPSMAIARDRQNGTTGEAPGT